MGRGDVDCFIYWIDHPIAIGNTKSASYVCYEAGILSAIAPRCYYALETE